MNNKEPSGAGLDGKGKPVGMETISGEQNLMVALRIRPLTDEEFMQGATSIAHKVDSNLVVLADPVEDPDDVLRVNRSRERQFLFDMAFGGSATQEKVYGCTTKFLIDNVVRGFNATVFAYGATGAGKTYTMLGTDDNPGIMVRALNDLFLAMENTKQDMAYSVSMSYLEVYNEMIRDLLNPSSGYLELREDHRGVHVAGLSQITTLSTQEVMELLKQGNQVRTQEPTAANPTSSRSHAVLQVSVRQRDRARKIQDEVRIGKLFLIDLAGSERASNNKNRGKRMVEGAHINRSLLALGNCINALSDKTSNKYINYRDSKLTRILKDALGGNCKTVMIAHVSPASLHFEESRNTLMYADRAKHIKTKVRRNVLDVSYHIAQYTSIIHELREEIGRLRNKLNEPSSSDNKRDKQLVSNIQSVQNEVMEPARKEELGKLKEQLVSVFKDQMDMRKTLLELNTTAMDINLDMARYQLLINEWDAERCRLRRKHSQLGQDNRAKDHEKEAELHGSDLYPEPTEISNAKDELQVLTTERAKTQKLKVDLQKQLEQTRGKAKKLEEVLPEKMTRDEEREILSLLCRVHELEMENTEMESLVLLKDHEIRRKDLMVIQSQQRRQLCHEIIIQQKQLIDENGIPYPKELQEMMNAYQRENEDILVSPETSAINMGNLYKASSMSSIYQRFQAVDRQNDLTPEQDPDVDLNDHKLMRKSTHSITKIDSGEKVFSLSPKTRHLKSELQIPSVEKSRDPDNSSIYTLSTQCDTPDLHDAKENGHDFHTTDVIGKAPYRREVINSKTRNIVALAARRRRETETDESSEKPVSSVSMTSHLTSNRHDDDRYEAVDDDLSSLVSDRMTNEWMGSQDRAPVNRMRYVDDKPQPMRHGRREVRTLHSRLVSKRKPRDNRHTQPGRPRIKNREDSDLRTFSNVNTPPSTVYQRDPERGRGMALQKQYRGPESSNASTPQAEKNTKRQMPSIPQNRKVDFSVKGHRVG